MSTQILRYSPVFLINSIIEWEETFENNSDSVVTVILNERSRAIANDTHWSKICSTVRSTSQAGDRGQLSPRSKWPCVRNECPILNLWIIISSRRGKRYKLKTFTFRSIAWSLFRVSELQRSCHCFSEWERMREQKSEGGQVDLILVGVELPLQRYLPLSCPPVRRDWGPTWMLFEYHVILKYALDIKCQQWAGETDLDF